MRSKQVYEINSAAAHNHSCEVFIFHSFVSRVHSYYGSVLVSNDIWLQARFERELTKTTIDCNCPGKVAMR